MSAKSKTTSEDGFFSPRLLSTVRFLLIAAAAVDAYLVWVSLSGGAAIGCGPESDCDKVLHSRWSSWFGVPVSALAMLVYAAMFVATLRLNRKSPPAEQRKAWRMLIPGAVLMLGAAVWFVFLQAVVIRSFCLYCMTAHALGSASALLLLFNCPLRATPEKSWQQEKQVFVPPAFAKKLAGAAVAGLALLVAGQTLHQPKSYVVQAVPGANAPLVATSAPPVAINPLVNTASPPVTATALVAQPKPGPTNPAPVAVAPDPTKPIMATLTPTLPPSPPPKNPFVIYGGRFVFDLDEVPMIGSPTAPHKMVSLFDYTCHHCRLLHGHLMEAFKALDGQLAIISLPMPLDSQCNHTVRRTPRLHTNACEYAKLGLAVWRANRGAHPQFDEWMFAPEHPPALEAARQHAAQLVGAEALGKAGADRWVREQLMRDISLYATNYIHVGQGSMPQLIIGTNLTAGTLNGVEELYRLLHQQLGVKPAR